MVFAVETYCPASDGVSAARIEEEVILTPDRPEGHLAVPGAGAADRQPVLSETRMADARSEARLDRHRPHGLRDGRAAGQGRRRPHGVEPHARQGRAAGGARRQGRATELTELAACDIVFVMVSTWDDVQGSHRRRRTVCCPAARRREVVVECSSISLEGSAELRALLAARGVADAGRAGLGQRQGHQGRQAVVRLLGAEGGVRRRAAVAAA